MHGFPSGWIAGGGLCCRPPKSSEPCSFNSNKRYPAKKPDRLAGCLCSKAPADEGVPKRDLHGP
jgi:hypothetical protein